MVDKPVAFPAKNGGIGADLLEVICRGFVPRLHGIHGLPHWRRVCENGLRLAAVTGANARVVELFAFLHDACRLNDGRDPDHGPRAAALVRSLQGSFFHLEEGELDMLAYACENHTRGLTEADLTVQVCWDADRLDLGRIGIWPEARRLCTPVAREPAVIEWGWCRSQGISVPCPAALGPQASGRHKDECREPHGKEVEG